MYQLTKGGIIIRLADQASIPMVADNSDYKAYLAWVAAGNTALPATPDDTAAVALAQADVDALAAAKANAVIRYLVTHTPAEINSKIQGDVTNLATAKDYLANLAIAVSVLGRQILR